MLLTQGSLQNYFTVINTGHRADIGIENTHDCTFDFNTRNSDTLLVTVGDSWTWGSDLSKDNDDTFRRKHVYGNILSEKLNCDWLNLGQGGSGNRWLCQKVNELINIADKLEYKKIYLVATLTEVGRAANSNYYQHIDYVQFFRTNNIENLLYHINNHTVLELVQSVSRLSNIQLIVGTNFVDHVGLDIVEENLLPSSWLSLCCRDELTSLTTPCYIVSPWVLDELKELKNLVPVNKQIQYLTWIDSLLDPALTRLNLLGQMKIMNKFHPNAHGHKLWAEYILNYINDHSKN